MNWSNCGRRVLIADLSIVAASTLFLSGEVGRLTVLSLFLQLIPFAPLGLVTPDQLDTETTRAVARAMSLVLNVLAFSLIAVPLYFGFRQRAPRTLLAILTA